MNADLLSNYCKSIKAIYHRKTNEHVDITTLEVKLHISQSSNTKDPCPKVFIYGNVVKKNNEYVCEYQCLKCSRCHVVSLNNIARKIKKGITCCRICKEQQDEKRQLQCQFMKQNASDIRNGCFAKEKANERCSILKKLENDAQLFDTMEDDFKENYFRKHLTFDEFERIKHKIVSFQHTKFTNISAFQYFPCVSINNQTRFNPYLYDSNRDVIEPINYIHYRCDVCEKEFYNRDLFIQKNKFKILCHDCNFTNNIFKIRSIKNIQNERITFQSKLEEKFIKFCNKNLILVQNGPRMPYKFNGKSRVYRVDFQLPQLNMLIECKDDHIWHRKSIASGNWDAKENAAKQYISSSDNVYNRYILIKPKTFVENTKYILSKTNKI